MTQNRNIAELDDNLMHEQIEKRAYEISQQRKGECGHELEDWLIAEQEVRRERPSHQRMR